MSFHDLPDTWADLPLTDSRLVSDVLDLVVSEDDRATGAIVLLLCDEERRLIQPCSLTEVDRAAPEADRRRVLDLFVEAMRDRPAGIVVGLARPRGTVPDDADRGWHQSAIDACADTSVELLGVHLVTGDGVVELPRLSGSIV